MITKFKTLIYQSVLFLTISFFLLAATAQNGSTVRPVDTDTLAEAIKEAIHAEVNAHVQMFRKNGVDGDKNPTIEVEYNKDRIKRIVVLSSSRESLNVIEFQYGNIDVLKDIPVAIITNGEKTDLSFFWKNIRTTLVNYFKRQSGIQQTLDLGPSPTGANIDRNDVKNVMEGLQDAVRPQLVELTERIAKAVISGMRIESAERAAVKAKDLFSVQFEDGNPAKPVVQENSTDRLNKEREELYRQLDRHNGKLMAGRLFNLLYYTAAIGFVGYGLYEAFGTEKFAYNSGNSFFSFKNNAIVGFTMIMGGLINGIPVFFDNFGNRIGRKYGYWSFTSMLFDLIINHRQYSARNSAAKKAQTRQQQAENQRAEALKVVKLSQKVGVVEVNLSKGEIQKVKVDATIVPQFNDRNAIEYGGVATAMHHAGANGMTSYNSVIANSNKQVPFGSAHLAPSGGGLSNYIIHITTVGSAEFIPEDQVERRQAYEVETIKESLREGIRAAIANQNIVSLSIPALGTGPLGTLGRVAGRSMTAILEVLREMQPALEASRIRRVEVVTYQNREFDSFREVLDKAFPNFPSTPLRPRSGGAVSCLSLFQ